MSSYSTLNIGPLQVDSWKNDIDPAIMMLFVQSDKRISPISLEQWVAEDGEEEDWSEDRCEVKYICTASEMRDRLELRGYTRPVAEESFRIGIQRRIKELTEALELSKDLLAKHAIDSPDPHYLQQKEMERRTLEILKTMTPGAWVDAVRSVRDSPFDRHVVYSDVAELAPELQYVLVWAFAQFGFLGADPRCMLRLVLAACRDDESVTYDLTDLVMGGEFDSESDMIQHAEYLISREYDVNRTTVVLTEGSTDRWILERSMRLIYPHLAPFFSFMDFDGVRLEGGAGSLANMVKAFAGAGILNRVIALFDNDTAGNSALQSLKAISLPPNIKTLSLPLLELAMNYPTLGPSGVSVMDINGLACGIELFLGAEILTASDGGLVPVQWKGYDARLRRYQGELLAKGDVLDRFRAKLATCESDPSRIGEYDWHGLRLVIDMLRSSFHEEDTKAHLEYEAWAANEH